ncbi:RNB-domain-containing protein [Cubamyces sp. BRFM 1775]|nr:RNB-domain-containing protein [Cubamyces sp. BRFM 1775]
MPPSMEKMMFAASEPPSATEAPVQDEEGAVIDAGERFLNGTLVEIRRSGSRAVGVVLNTHLYERSWQVQTLTLQGEVWEHHEHDVVYQIPSFVDEEFAKACGTGPEPTTDSEMKARVRMLHHLRKFEKSLEAEMHLVLDKTRSKDLYGRVRNLEPTQWSVLTVDDAVNILYQTPTVVTETRRLAVQTYLMDFGPHYLAEQRRFLQQQRFWVRPLQQVENIEIVNAMAKDNDPALDAFADKARALVLASRKRAAESWNEPPARHPLEGVEFTEKEMRIISFLRDSLGVLRRIQEDYFGIPVAQILKKVGLYDPDLYGPAVTNVFLVELGVLAPWEDAVTRLQSPHHDENALDDITDYRPTKGFQDISPEGFYTRDIVDSLRHDFGDAPVCVIDDWGAEELDDGISAERDPLDPSSVWLHVHIADPTCLLSPTHAIARSALQLTNTRYYVDRTIPMLPPDVGFSEYSLGHVPDQPSKTMSFSAKVNAAGEIVDYKVRPGIIRNVHRLKYDVIDALLDAPSPKTFYPFGNASTKPAFAIPSLSPAVTQVLRLLQETSRALLQARLRKGAITLALPMPDITIQPRPLPDNILSDGTLRPSLFSGFVDIQYALNETVELGSRAIVAEAMKASCRIASLFFRDRGLPALRRSVGEMQSEHPDGMEKLYATRDENGIVDYYESIRSRLSAPSARYLTTPGPHSLLGVPDGEGYVKVTSPLRRFGDILAHWQIKYALLAEKGERHFPLFFQEEWLSRMGQELELRELDARRLERSQVDYWSHLYLTRWMNDPAADQRQYDPLQHLTGRALSVPIRNLQTKMLNMKVYVQELGLTGQVLDVPSTTTLLPGEEVEVVIKDVKLGTRPQLGLMLKE